MGKKVGPKLSLSGRRRLKEIKGDIGARGIGCQMRETPQELVGIKQRQNTTEASSKHRRDWIHISQVLQEYPPGSFSELFPSKQKAFNSGDRQILLGIKD